jgi:hypothetical protein
MNKLYTATTKYVGGYIYISAKNGKEAREIALKTDYLSQEDFIDIRIKLIKDGNGVQRTNLPSKELNTREIIVEELTWWCCYECDAEDFEYVDEFNCKCKSCGDIFHIPFAD